jgi:hypothetical protein
MIGPPTCSVPDSAAIISRKQISLSDDGLSPLTCAIVHEHAHSNSAQKKRTFLKTWRPGASRLRPPFISQGRPDETVVVLCESSPPMNSSELMFRIETFELFEFPYSRASESPVYGPSAEECYPSSERDPRCQKRRLDGRNIDVKWKSLSKSWENDHGEMATVLVGS